VFCGSFLKILPLAHFSHFVHQTLHKPVCLRQLQLVIEGFFGTQNEQVRSGKALLPAPAW
jgi:hypothetical protein